MEGRQSLGVRPACRQTGQPAYDAEFLDAFSWWLSEKAERWLESKASGGPIPLDTWVNALWQDSRLRAAWQVTTEITHRLDLWKRDRANKPPPKSEPKPTQPNFTKYFRTLVKTQTVPDNIPYAVPWNELEASGQKIPAAVKRIRGKLNVPRERFQVTPEGNYKVSTINNK